MNLRKIIIGLSAIGLVTCASAKNKDKDQLGADFDHNAASTLMLCNFYDTPVTWNATTDDGANPVVLGNTALKLEKGQCKTVSLQGLDVTKGNLNIANVTLTSKLEDGSAQVAIINISQIVQIDKKITEWMYATKVKTVDNNTIYLFAKEGVQKLEASKDPHQNRGGRTGADYVFCSAPDEEASKQCKDSYKQ